MIGFGSVKNLSILLLPWSLCACEEVEDASSQFNASGESLTISVGVEEVLPPVERMLHSTTGLVEIGQAYVVPGGGPIGTSHQIQVEVFDEWEEEVSQVVVKTDSGSRGTLEYNLIPDSADLGVYILDLESVGDPGEVRDDVFTLNLWTGDVIDTDTGTD